MNNGSRILKKMTPSSKNIAGNVAIPFPAPHFPVGTELHFYL